MTLDVHLMIEAPHRFIKDFAEAGSDIITIHAEAYSLSSGNSAGILKGASKSTDKIDEAFVKKTLAEIRALGRKAGISINPGSSAGCIKNIYDDADMILLMSVHPGFAGQKFIEDVLSKISEVRKVYKGDIEVDGGINDKNAGKIIDAGANIIVAGSYFFNAEDPKEAIKKLRGK
jgi:ribulose-phosphate 3-epimerase